MDAHSGFSVSEALVVLALLALVAAVSLPNLSETRRRTDLQRLARQVAADALRARMEALWSCRNVGLVFAEQEGRPYYVMVADGNANGVSRQDFLRNVDRALGPRVWLEFLSAGTRLGVPREWHVPDPSGDGTLGEQGLRAGRAAIISFSRHGSRDAIQCVLQRRPRACAGGAGARRPRPHSPTALAARLVAVAGGAPVTVPRS